MRSLHYVLILFGLMAVMVVAPFPAKAAVDLNVNVGTSVEWRQTESLLSQLTIDKARLATGQVGIIKLHLVGPNGQSLAHRAVLIKIIGPSVSGEQSAITDNRGELSVNFASLQSGRLVAQAFDRSVNPSIRIIASPTVIVTGPIKKGPVPKVTIILNGQNKSTTTLWQSVLGFVESFAK